MRIKTYTSVNRYGQECGPLYSLKEAQAMTHVGGTIREGVKDGVNPFHLFKTCGRLLDPTEALEKALDQESRDEVVLAFCEWLQAQDMAFHFDDDPSDLVGEPFTAQEAAALNTSIIPALFKAVEDPHFFACVAAQSMDAVTIVYVFFCATPQGERVAVPVRTTGGRYRYESGDLHDEAKEAVKAAGYTLAYLCSLNSLEEPELVKDAIGDTPIRVESYYGKYMLDGKELPEVAPQ